MADDAAKSTAGYGLNPTDEMNDLRMSAKAMPLLEHVKRFIKETVEPMTVEFVRLGEVPHDTWSFAPGQLDVLQTAKDKAKAEGLWNFFLPDADTGEGLSNLDYAYIAVELAGREAPRIVRRLAKPHELHRHRLDGLLDEALDVLEQRHGLGAHAQVVHLVRRVQAVTGG